MKRNRMYAMIAGAIAAGLATGIAIAQAPEDAVDPGCPPDVRDAIAAAGELGVDRGFRVIRSQETGIREPAPLLDLGCIADLFSIPYAGLLSPPTSSLADLLRLLQRRVCAGARQAYRESVSRDFHRTVFRRRTLLPGLRAPVEAVPRRRTGTESDNRSGGGSMRTILGGGASP